MELILALVLFVGMITCWLMLPATAADRTAEVRLVETSGESGSSRTVRQPA